MEFLKPSGLGRRYTFLTFASVASWGVDSGKKSGAQYPRSRGGYESGVHGALTFLRPLGYEELIGNWG